MSNEKTISNSGLMKYSDENTRRIKVNQTALISSTFIEILLIFALFVQTFAIETSYGKLGLIPATILLLGLLVSWITYKKDNSSEKLKYIMLISFAIGWTYIMITGENVMVTFYIYPMLISTILYHDKKYENIMFYILMGVSIIRTLIWIFNGYMFGGSNIAFISMVINFELVIVVHIISKLSQRFTNDMMQSVINEQQVQNKMVQDILRISESVKEEVTSTADLIDSLHESSNLVYSSIKDISVQTQETVSSTQKQREMTEMINSAINETVENAKVMVATANDSAKMMKESMNSIKDIRENAEQIGETNSHVAETMEELQKKSNEVQQITEVIFSISNQTNLLALNASIESARAGEAGRGFGVVANQIRTLSEETKQATEQIAGIIQELNQHAQDATNIVSTSIEAMNKQNNMVEAVADNFGTIGDNISVLTQRIEDINSKIHHLLKSNNNIIENIHLLSASSEQISTNAKDVEMHSSNNQMEAEEAKQLLSKIRKLVAELTKYKNITQ